VPHPPWTAALSCCFDSVPQAAGDCGCF
jgi:hypothetical protein